MCVDWLNHVNLHSVKLHIIFVELMFKTHSKLRIFLLTIVTTLFYQSLEFISLAFAETVYPLINTSPNPAPSVKPPVPHLIF